MSYSTGTPVQGQVELRCLRYNTADDCFLGANPISYTQILKVVEKLPPNGSTNMAQGMLRGLEALGINANNQANFNNNCSNATDHCGRGGAAKRVMILMTDGVANVNPWGTGVATQNCYASDLYQPNIGDDFQGEYSQDRAKDCAIFYAQKAADANVTIYAVGLGNGVDVDFMQAIANYGMNSQYFAAASPAYLDAVFEAILHDLR